MTPTPASVHGVVRLAKGLIIASIRANMDSRENSEKSDLGNEHLENTPSNRNDTLHGTTAAYHERRIAREKAANRKGELAGIFQKLGNLPEWNVPRYGQLHGKALNNGIAWASCLAFLMFGMSKNQSIYGTQTHVE